jgi:N-acetylglucosaminyldiphosphoundecaprenol N-acetyl-beta-D-mannosaminyltransferase
MTDNRVPFLGLYFDDLDLPGALARIEEFIAERKPRMIFTPNVALLVWARSDEFLRNTYNNCDMVTVDGMAIYYALKALRTPLKAPLSASLMFYPLFELSQEKGYKIFMVGAQERVVATAVDNLHEQYPEAQIVGYHHGYFDTENPPAELIREIQETKPDLLMIGMATPYKERFVVSNLAAMNVPVSLAVGGMFDIAAGEARFAPIWIRKLALEWLYRLLQEPRRMWKRYLTTNSIFLCLFFKEFIKRRILFIRD